VRLPGQVRKIQDLGMEVPSRGALFGGATDQHQGDRRQNRNAEQ